MQIAPGSPEDSQAVDMSTTVNGLAREVLARSPVREPDPQVSSPATDERGVFLSTLEAGRGQRRLALAVVLVCAVIFLAAVPFAKRPLAQVWAFMPVYHSALVINDLITAVLLFGQFSILRSRALCVLASAYLFTAFMGVVHALSFPGLFAPTGLLGAGPQTTAWLDMFWHGGFPLLLVVYALRSSVPRAASPHRRHPSIAITGSIVSVLIVAGGFTLVATTRGVLPAIMLGTHYTPAMSLAVSSVGFLSLLALVILWRRRPHSVLDLWLMVVMCAWLFDIALATVLNGGRFDLGFYAGRIYGLLAASFVLLALLLENGLLYARLIAVHDRERQERQRVQRAEEAAAAANRDRNERGEGTRCAVDLAAGQRAPVPVSTHAARAAKPEAPGSGGRVLYIEDELANLRLIERVLGLLRPGVTLMSAMQARQGLDLARDHRPELIVMDLHLPDLSGTEVLARLLADPLTRDIPVVVLSIDATPSQVARLLAQGARAYLTKPVDVEEFLVVLEGALA